MQKEIMKKARLYGLAAVLLAIVLVSVCYQLGYIPRLSNPNNTAAMTRFSSLEDLENFIKNRSTSQWGDYYAVPFSEKFISIPTSGPTALSSAAPPATDVNGGVQWSFTNVQVAGVDEADIAKTDGQYIYLVSGGNVSILRAYPPEDAGLVSKITFVNMTPVGIFVSGDRLAVVCTKYTLFPEPLVVSWVYNFGGVGTYVNVYDISNRSQPELVRSYEANGGYFDSRMIGDYIYFVTNQPSEVNAEVLPNITVSMVNFPTIKASGFFKATAPTDIYYANVTDNYFLFTTIFALNIKNDAETPTSSTIMLGGTSTMYVSLNNLYVTFPGTDGTMIYRVHIADSTITPQAQGQVPGQVLNQFSMDEYNDYFRIATTTWGYTNYSSSPTNNVYVLDMNMTVVGKLQDLAPGEHIYSARFMGNRCYLVTFVSVDPLFVIDLSDPVKPKVLGQLSIPGYSSYLHPYDENHIIGVGKEATPADEGYFAWYQGVKISLFDVTDVTNPVQVANYTIGDRGTSSPVLYDHEAFLFDKDKDLLVIPALVYRVDTSQYAGGSVPPNAYGQPVWQGACVFNITLSGLDFRGGITHIDNSSNIFDYSHYVERSMYIGNVLYTISQAEVKLNSLDDLSLIKDIQIG